MTSGASPVTSATAPDTPSAARGVVVTYAASDAENPRRHEAVTRREIAKKLAELKGLEFAGEFDPAMRYPGSVYFVPSDTLVGVAAERLGISSEQDLFGAVVPFRFMGTKTITHSLVDGEARGPDGWSEAFARRVYDSALHGYSAFRKDDAYRAGLALLEEGPVRVKHARGIGGRGQAVARRRSELADILDPMDAEELARHGIVLEEDLSDVTTYGVGQVRIAGVVASYWGTQRLIANNHGVEVYGGSDLFVVRGDFDALLATSTPPDLGLAIAQARMYDVAASECFAGFIASRRNYDVVQGHDSHGRRRSGVLEQSWRIGGASGAEVAALHALRADPSLTSIRASSFEIYGPDATPPTDAQVLFRGVDEHVGPIMKYVMVESHADTR